MDPVLETNGAGKIGGGARQPPGASSAERTG